MSYRQEQDEESSQRQVPQLSVSSTISRDPPSAAVVLDPPHLYSHSATGLSAPPSLSFTITPPRYISHRWPLAATRPRRSRTGNARGCWRRSDNGTHTRPPRPQGTPGPRPSRTATTRQLSPVSERLYVYVPRLARARRHGLRVYVQGQFGDCGAF